MLIDPYKFGFNFPTEAIAVANGLVSTNLAVLAGAYPSLDKDATVIETFWGVPSIGMVEMAICYVNNSVAIQDDIFVDITDTTTFWTDILNWCYSNNLYGITFNSGDNTYLVNDPNIPTFITIAST